MPAPAQRLEMLARYKAWANARLYAALAGLAERELAAPRRIFAGSILRTLHHVYLMDTVWQAHLRGVAQPPATTRNPETTPPFAELRDAQASIDAWYADYARSLSPDLGAEVVAFDFIGGDAGAMRRDDMLLHVVTHAAYHRGHIAAVLNLLGIAPPVTDLPVFLREPGPPTA